ncbi:MAG: baseplate J/gp47 family protein [Sphingomonas sp.]|nr:baseplate J/gp47 family protein [Sphingomonas sp.]
MLELVLPAATVDLSRLPAPVIVPSLGLEAERAALIADLVERYPDFTATLESDPAIKQIEAFAWRVELLRRTADAGARGLLLAYASGAVLDQLGAFVGVVRLVVTPADPEAGTPAVLEKDDDLRQRIALAPASFSVAGPSEAYVFFARAADARVAHASATSPSPREVIISVLARDGDGTAPPDLIAAVAAIVNAKPVRPLTDLVTVQSADIIDFAVEAEMTLFAGPDRNLVTAAASARLDDYLASSRQLGRDITRSAISAALHVEGVQRVALASPAADVVCDPTQAAHCTAITIEVVGYGD